MTSEACHVTNWRWDKQQSCSLHPISYVASFWGVFYVRRTCVVACRLKEIAEWDSTQHDVDTRPRWAEWNINNTMHFVENTHFSQSISRNLFAKQHSAILQSIKCWQIAQNSNALSASTRAATGRLHKQNDTIMNASEAGTDRRENKQ